MMSGTAKVLKILSGIGVVAFLNLMAGKEEFGLFMIAYSVAFMVAVSIETFFQNLILYHTGRAEEGVALNAHPIMPASLYWGSGVSALAGVLIALAAPLIESLMGHAGLAPWIVVMAAFIPAHTLLTLLTSCYRAQHKVVTMAVYFDVLPSVLLVGGTALVWLAGWSVYAVGWMHSAAFVLPFLILFLKEPVLPPAGWLAFTRWDIGYGFKSMAVYIANQPGLGLDVLFVGQFCDVGTTAEYAMASRFAQVLMLPKMAITQLQIPRMGRFFKAGDNAGLRHEFEAMQDISLLATVFGCLCYVVLALPVMNLFGDYSAAYSILMVLCAASLIKAGFGASGGYLGMAGYAGWLFITNAGAVLVLVVSMLLFVPWLEGMGAGYALAVHALATMGSMSLVIHYKDRLSLMRPFTALYLAAVIVVLALCGHGMIGMAVTSLALIVMSALYLYAEPVSIRFFRPQGKVKT